MAHRLTTAPQVQILTADDAREQCRITDDIEDTYLEKLIKRATAYCENRCKRAFITQVWTLTLNGFDDCRYVTDGIIEVPRPPLLAVDGTVLGTTLGITYLDTDGVSTALATDQYRVDTQSQPGRIESAFEVLWPFTRRVIGDVSIVHSAGYGTTAESVPAEIHHAIAIGVASLRLNREEFTEAAKQAMDDLLDPYIMAVYV